MTETRQISEQPTCKISDGDFFTQTLKVGENADHSWEYCSKLCKGKVVLHIGCSDYPIFNKDGNLHIHLSNITSRLEGCDTNGIDEMRKHYNGVYYENIESVVSSRQEYDVILMPNIIEHLVNPNQMVEQIFKIKFRELFVLVPNYSVSVQATYENGIFTERIHPDHYAWYSPYTLWNLFKDYIEISKATCELNFFDSKKMISICIKLP